VAMSWPSSSAALWGASPKDLDTASMNISVQLCCTYERFGYFEYEHH
jgi:hypothetical protein